MEEKRRDQNVESAMRVLKYGTPARLGIGHTGTRYKTDALLDFWEAQGRAADAVQAEVPKEVVNSLGVFEVRTRCRDKYEMLTRPDLGRLFDEDARRVIRQRCLHGVDVEIYFGDGLCSPAIEANIPILYPALKEKLQQLGLTVGTPFFVRYCRVNTARTIGQLLDAKLTCVLIGERPGLLTSESMSAYMAVNARPDMSESDYRVVSNISRFGTDPLKAANTIAVMMRTMLGISDQYPTESRLH